MYTRDTDRSELSNSTLIAVDRIKLTFNINRYRYRKIEIESKREEEIEREKKESRNWNIHADERHVTMRATGAASFRMRAFLDDAWSRLRGFPITRYTSRKGERILLYNIAFGSVILEVHIC